MSPEMKKDPNQLVAYNMARFRERVGMSQAELGSQLVDRTYNKSWKTAALVSAAERSWASENRFKTFDAGLLLGLSDIFDVPLGAWFIPPAEEDCEFGPVWGWMREKHRRSKYDSTESLEPMQCTWSAATMLRFSGLTDDPTPEILDEPLRMARRAVDELTSSERTDKRQHELRAQMNVLRELLDQIEHEYYSAGNLNGREEDADG